MTVTSLSLTDFGRLVNAGVFNSTKMNDAVWKFRTFEEPSLTYKPRDKESTTRGGWNIRRDERFASLIERGLLEVGDKLESIDPIQNTTALVTEDFGLLIGGVRYESPDIAAEVSSEGRQADGWSYWSLFDSDKTQLTLRELLAKI